MYYEYDTPWARQRRADEIDAAQEQAAKESIAERLTIQLEKHLDAKEWDATIPHPACEQQQIEVRELLSEYLAEALENKHTVAQALILAGAGNPQGASDLLDGFTKWYHEELMA